MSLKFYLDTHIPKPVAIQLQEAGIKGLRCEEIGMADASDEAHLIYASSNGLAMVSMDDDFIDLHFQWLEQDKSHLGIFKISHKLQGNEGIGAIFKALFEYHGLIAEGAATLDKDIHNQLIFIR